MENIFEWIQNNKTKFCCILLGIVVAIVVIIFIALPKNSNTSKDEKDVNEQTTETVAPTLSPPIQAEVAEQADYEGVNDPENNMFVNNKVLTASDNNGATLSLGIESNDVKDNSTGIILNPTYSKAADVRKIGYYIDSETIREIRTSKTEYHDIDNEEIAASKNVLIDWTYDKLMPAQYVNSDDYGVCWSMSMNDPNVTEDTVKIVVIDLNSHQMLSVFRAQIARNDDGKFELQEVWNDDISSASTDKLNELWIATSYNSPLKDYDLSSTRNELIELAKEELRSGTYITVDENLLESQAVVELTKKSYHTKFLTFNHDMGYSGNFTYPIWAVTLNVKYPGIGHITFYFTKENFICLGCDFVYINTQDTLNQYAIE